VSEGNRTPNLRIHSPVNRMPLAIKTITGE
jgi:hypothetical protein